MNLIIFALNHMKPIAARELARRFRDQYGFVSRAQLYALGIGSAATLYRVATGEWELLSRKVVRLAGSTPAPEQALLALCLAAGPGSVAPHRSAAWLWRLSDPPEQHEITVPRNCSARALGAQVHRPRSFSAHIVTLRQIPCTEPLRTVIGLAAVTAPDELDAFVDRALGIKLVDLDGTKAGTGRAAMRGRPGVEAARAALTWRRSAGLAQPSVLEPKTLRLLQGARIKPAGLEVKAGDDLEYRVDIYLCPGLAMEVDGYAYHRSSEQMAADTRRRNRLYPSGTQVLVYTWRDVIYDGHRVVAEARDALAQRAEALAHRPA